MALPLRRKVSLVWRLFRDPQVPLAARAALPALGAYLAMPFDLVPDFIPVLGQLDDVVVVAGGLALVLWLTPPHVLERHIEALE